MLEPEKLIKECRKFRISLEDQITAFEKRVGGEVTHITLARCPDVNIHQFDVGFGDIVVKAGGRLPF